MLFREQAIEHQRARVLGATTLPVPLPLTVTTGFLAVSLLAFGVLLAGGSYTRKAHVAGFLAPHRGVVRILPPRAGTIVCVHVHEGELVHAGDPLLTVSAAQANGSGQDVDAAMLDGLRRQLASLHDQMALEQRRTATLRAADEAAARGLDLLLAALRAERDIQSQRTALARRDLDAAATLRARGDMSPLEERRRQDAYLAQREAESSIARTILEKQAEAERLRHDLADLPLASAQRLAVSQGAAAELSSRMEALEGQRAYLLTAPSAGLVSSLLAWVGKPADPAMPQMSIVPEGDTMQAQLLVPARAIGFVKPGQHVRLSYDAFPYQQFGFADATVETISHTLLKPGELSGPVSSDEPVFRVTATLARQTIRALGADVVLQTDTPLQADILLDRRSLFRWVVKL